VILGIGLPLDGAVREARVDGHAATVKDEGIEGDVHRFSVEVSVMNPKADVRFSVREGSDVYRTIDRVADGARNSGLRILRSRAGRDGLALRLEGLAGTREVIRLRSPRRLGPSLPDGVRLLQGAGDPTIAIAFDGPEGEYVRRDVMLPLSAAAGRP
jgi:hypothetical protein